MRPARQQPNQCAADQRCPPRPRRFEHKGCARDPALPAFAHKSGLLHILPRRPGQREESDEGSQNNYGRARTYEDVCEAPQRERPHHGMSRNREHAPRGLRRELGEDGQGERGCLARASLRDADEVVPRENRRDGRGLNGSRLGVAGFLHGFENVGIEAKETKRHRMENWVQMGGSCRGDKATEALIIR